MSEPFSRRFTAGATVALALLTLPGAMAHGQGGPGGPPDLKAMAQTGALFDAIRRHDRAALVAALDQGADPNRPNWLGFSAFEWAVAMGDSPGADLLLQRGAKMSQGVYGPGSPLLFCLLTGQEAKALELLDRGIETTVRRPDGGSLLMMAAAFGAPRVIERLRPGAVEVNAKDTDGATALIYAARLGQVEAARKLLAAGAKVDTADKHGRTALLYAAANGHLPMAQLLLAQGADARRTDATKAGALHLVARYSGDVALAKTLIQARAPLALRDRAGHTPLALARLRGYLPLAQALKAAGAPAGAAVAPPALRPAIARSLNAIQGGMKRFLAQSECASCHHQGLGTAVLGYARLYGFAVDKDLIAGNTKRTMGQFGQMAPLAQLAQRRPEMRIAMPTGEMEELAIATGYLFWGLDANQVTPTPELIATAQFIAQEQNADGHWQFTIQRGPMQASQFLTTALNIASVRRYLPAEQQATHVENAVRWLKTAPVVTTEDRAARLLGLTWAGVASSPQDPWVRELVQMQRSDGGWGARPGKVSDPHTTGFTLYSLQIAGIAQSSPALRRGTDYLLRTQDEDGAWYLNKTVAPLNFFFDTGFPGGESQYTSFGASSWATLALLEATRPKDVARK